MPLDTIVTLILASSNIVSTSACLTILVPSALLFFKKLLFINSNYGEKFLGLTAASDGSNIRRISNETLHHHRSNGILPVTVLRSCWLRGFQCTKLWFARNVWNSYHSKTILFSFLAAKSSISVLCVHSFAFLMLPTGPSHHSHRI